MPKHSHKFSFLSLLLFILSIIAITGIIYGYYIHFFQTSTVMTNSLSPRAEEFLRNQTKNGDGPWSQMQLESDSSSPSSTSTLSGIITTPCFQFLLSYPVTRPQFEIVDQRCSWRAKTLSPLGLLVVAKYPSNNFNEDSGIQLRRREKAQYQEYQLKTGTTSKFAVLFRGQDSVTAFTMIDHDMYTVAISGVSQIDLVTNDAISTIVQSLQSREMSSASATP